MQKREVVLLAKSFDKQYIGGYLISEKLDGQRCIWDGGITLGQPVEKVPFAYRPKPGLISTGLWSRNFKPIMAPKSWIQQLPMGVPLDGELYLGRGLFQVTESITRREVPDEKSWQQVKYCVFDIPSYSELFKTGRCYIFGVDHFINYEDIGGPYSLSASRHWHKAPVEIAHQLIPKHLLHKHERLPLSHTEALDVMWKMLDDITAGGGEGVMLRQLNTTWTPKRSDCLLKVKRTHDAECRVIGYTEGEGKYKGMLGALKVVDLDSNLEFELSGMTDAERTEAFFPLGTILTYKYNDKTDSGMPRFPRYMRKRDLNS